MIDGIRIELNTMLRPDMAALRRSDASGPPMVVKLGSVADVMGASRPGDVVLVSESIWHGLQAQFAKDVTPDREGR